MKRPSATATKCATASAPGKIILFGEHAVVYPSMRAIAATIDLRTEVTVTQGAPDGELRISLPDVGLDSAIIKSENLVLLGKRFDFDSQKCGTDEVLKEEVGKLVNSSVRSKTTSIASRALVAILIMVLGILKTQIEKGRWEAELSKGIHITTNSKIPTGSGLGSSASFCVATAGALLKYCNMNGRNHSKKRKIDHADAPTRELPDADLNFINSWAFVGESALHGTVSGIDNTVVCYGGANIYVKGSPLVQLKGFPPLRILLTNTEIEKDTKKQVGIVSDRMKIFPTVTKKIVEAIGALVDQCCELFDKYYTNEISLEKVIEDSKILMGMNHGLLVSLGVSHPSLEKVVEITARNSLTSKLTGAGGGGCAFTLIPPDYDEKLLRKTMNELHDSGFQTFECLVGCDGVQMD